MLDWAAAIKWGEGVAIAEHVGILAMALSMDFILSVASGNVGELQCELKPRRVLRVGPYLFVHEVIHDGSKNK